MPPTHLMLALALGAASALPAAPAPVPAPDSVIPPLVATAVSPPSPGAGRIAANTVVVLELVDGVSSKTNLRGDQFKLRLAEPLRAGDRVLVPAGSVVVGEVLHAQKSGGGGRAGELTIAARYIETPSGRIRLRSSIGSAGVDHTKSALATSFVAGPFALMIHGSERILPAGSLITSKTAVDIDLDAAGHLIVAPPATSPSLPPEGKPAT